MSLSVTHSESYPQHADAIARLRAAFASKPLDNDAIRGAVCGYVDEMKKGGAPVERVIVDIKQIAGLELGPEQMIGRPTAPEPSGESLALSRAVTWCIERYFWTGGANDSS